MTTDARKEGRIFVSSTCHDLVDLRAMLEVKLKESGLTPVMSDRPTSEFTNPGEANSIEVCLQNLRQCERVILVLSQRYGRSLKERGFEDVSATHLEYNEARKASIPILFYVRDRLNADYEQHRKNPGAKPLWAKEPDSTALYEMIKHHRELTNTEQNNWFLDILIGGRSLRPRTERSGRGILQRKATRA